MSLAAGSQPWHTAPAAPQLPRLGALQTPPEQQPVGHEVASQTQPPETHRWPAAQAAAPPQVHAPAALQASLAAGSQPAQAPPGAPHVRGASAVQVPAAQQPVGHEAASHPQTPATQCWPALQAAAPPQLHAPDAEQVSAVTGLQATHAAPPMPQVPSPEVEQVAPEQQPPQPLTQLLHAPPGQLSPTGQVAQAAPPLPHAAVALPVSQDVPWQQPAQLVESHRQFPAAQCCPARQAAAAPQAQPAGPQASARRGSHAAQLPPAEPQVASDAGWQLAPSQQPEGHDEPSHTQPPPWHREPSAHSGPAPQPQVPSAAQVSARVTSHPAQVAPARPHWVRLRVWQAAAWQQPPGHEISSQVHSPAWQRWPAAQGAPLPHSQAPSAEQRSDRASQAAHAAAPTPQVDGNDGWQVLPMQQPFGQVTVLQSQHTPWVQPTPVAQAAQVAPAVPQAVAMVPGRQTPPWQQPVGHDWPSHTQAPAEQRCPESHEDPEPQWQAPSVPQASARSGSQATHAAPPAPQPASDGTAHPSAVQHPAHSPQAPAVSTTSRSVS